MEDNIFKDEVFLVYGRPKIGKSTFASQFPKPLFVATEPGLKYIRGLTDAQRQYANSWEKIVSLFSTIRKQIDDGVFKYETVILDTVDNAIDYCTTFVCKKEGVSHPSEVPHGKGWNKITVEFKRVLHILQLSGVCLVLISHDKMVDVETKTEKYSKTQLALTGKNREAVLNMPDHILYIDSDVEKGTEQERRFIRVRSSKYFECGTRNDILAQQNTVLLDVEELKKYHKLFLESIK